METYKLASSTLETCNGPIKFMNVTLYFKSSIPHTLVALSQDPSCLPFLPGDSFSFVLAYTVVTGKEKCVEGKAVFYDMTSDTTITLQFMRCPNGNYNCTKLMINYWIFVTSTQETLSGRRMSLSCLYVG